MEQPKQGVTPLQAAGMMAGAVSAGVGGVAFTAWQPSPYTAATKQGQPMTPQDEALINARIDVRVAELKGDIRLNTDGLANLKDRLGDLSAKLATVPTDLATLKARVDVLPDKDWVGTKMRNWVGGAAVLIGALNIALRFYPFH